LRGGNKAVLTAPPKEAILRALPFFVMNHWGGRVVLLRLMDPCPNNLMAKKPINRITKLLTRLIPRHATPNKRATKVVMIRCPHRSNKPPIIPIMKPAVKVPIEYKLETSDLLQPNSAI